MTHTLCLARHTLRIPPLKHGHFETLYTWKNKERQRQTARSYYIVVIACLCITLRAVFSLSTTSVPAQHGSSTTSYTTIAWDGSVAVRLRPFAFTATTPHLSTHHDLPTPHAALCTQLTPLLPPPCSFYLLPSCLVPTSMSSKHVYIPSLSFLCYAFGAYL